MSGRLHVDLIARSGARLCPVATSWRDVPPGVWPSYDALADHADRDCELCGGVGRVSVGREIDDLWHPCVCVPRCDCGDISSWLLHGGEYIGTRCRDCLREMEVPE